MIIMTKKENNPLASFMPNFIIEHLGINSKLKDSLTIDTPSKGGELKVYFDADDIADSERRISNAVELRCFAQNKIAECQQCKSKSGNVVDNPTTSPT